MRAQKPLGRLMMSRAKITYLKMGGNELAGSLKDFEA